MLPALYLLSGAASLIYEVAWSRLFTLHLGGLVPAITALLVAQLGGMALGGFLGGRWAQRAGRPLRRFAALETGTALLGLAVAPGLVALGAWFRHLYAAHLETGTSFVLPAAATAGLLVIPAAVLMGATLPTLAGLAGGGAVEAGAAAGRLYAVNTLGAVAGALAAGLELLPRLGLQRTLATAAALNVLVAAAAWVLDARAARGAVRTPRPAESTGRRSGTILAAMALAGAASMAAQIGWTRALALSLGSSTYAFTVTLSAFLAGLALGGGAGARWGGHARAPARALAALQGGAGLASLVSLYLLGRLPIWIIPPLARSHVSLSSVLTVQGVAAAAVILLPTFLLGAAFPVAVRLRGEAGCPAGRAAGDVYAAGSAGLVAGAMAAGALLLPGLGLERTLLAASLALAAAGLLSAAAATPAERRGAAGLAMTVAGLAAITAIVLPRWDPSVVTSGPFLYAPLYRDAAAGDKIEHAIRSRGDLLLLREGAAATVTVRRTSTGILSLQINGKTDASTGGDMVTQLLAGHLPALLAPPQPESALLIGLATGVSLGALERYPFHRIDCVELIPEVVEAAPWFSVASGNALEDPRVDVLVGDGRSHLLYGGRRYDVITSQPTNPWVAGTAALYTREAFEAARSSLRNGGVFSQWIQGYSLLPEDLRSVVGTFLEVFPGATLWEESPGGGDYFLIGYRRPSGSIDPVQLEERLRRPAVAADLARAGIGGAADLLAHFVAGPDALSRYSAGAPLQEDDRLALEFSAPRALYLDTLPDQVRSLRRWRESPAPLLGPAPLSPELLARLRAARADARREERLVLSLRRARVPVRSAEMELGLELLQAGLRAPAEYHLRAAAVERPDLAEARALLGAVLLSSNRPEEARRELEAAVRADPQDVASLALLARLEVEQGDAAAAERHASAALRREPDDADLQNLLGAARLLQERPREAADALERALELDPGMAEAWTNLGVAWRRTGDRAGAERAYRRALEIEPGAPDARFNLAVSRMMGGDALEAAALLASVVRDDPVDLEARWQRARALRELGRDGEARRELETIVAVAPGSAEANRAAEALRSPPPD